MGRNKDGGFPWIFSKTRAGGNARTDPRFTNSSACYRWKYDVLPPFYFFELFTLV
jgi:hypothetical protein